MSASRLDQVAAALPRAYPGPGGAMAVLKDGQVLLRHAWGWANAERRIPFTPRSLFRICSITKQFTCATLLESLPDPRALDAALAARLPLLEQAPPDILSLCHNQSGLRDYWALAMLQGSPVEAPFGDAESARLIAGTRSLHFAPGTRYSYVNQNFRLISELLEQQSGRDFASLLRDKVLTPAGMEHAILAADTRAMPDGTEGYEGNAVTGFRAAENRILWTGDAGLGASLDDLIAWERSIDAGRDDAEALYARLSAPVAFADGRAAAYGFGLARGTELGRAVTGHGGALRGWRSHRLHLRAERLSVVVLFNHMADAHGAALDLLAAVLEEPLPEPAAALPPPPWLGTYREPETGLAVRMELAGPGRLRLRFGHVPELLALQADGTACNARARLRPGPGGLWMDRPAENLSSCLQPGAGEAATDIAGLYRCAELEAELLVAESGGQLYGGFSGALGQGRMEALEPAGPDLWMLPCPRALDHAPPGDWTLAFRRDAAGQVSGLILGCWLARGLYYARQ